MSQQNKRAGLLTADEELQLIRAAQTGDQQAYERLIEANQRLIWQWVNRYVSPQQEPEQAEDLFQEASIGLFTAIRKFNVEGGGRLSTYATFWLKQTLSRETVQRQRFVRVPVYIGERLQRLKHFRQSYEQDHQRQPTEEQCAQHLQLSLNDVRTLLFLLRHPQRIDVPRFEKVSDDKPQGYSLADTTDSIQEHLDALHQHELVKQCLNILPERERLVILWRFFHQMVPGMKSSRLKRLDAASISRESVRVNWKNKVYSACARKRFVFSSKHSVLFPLKVLLLILERQDILYVHCHARTTRVSRDSPAAR